MSDDVKKCPFCSKEMGLISDRITITDSEELKRNVLRCVNGVNDSVSGYELKMFNCDCGFVAFFSK